jgi:hypothetical protein
MDLKEMEWERMDWTHMAQAIGIWQAPVNTALGDYYISMKFSALRIVILT